MHPYKSTPIFDEKTLPKGLRKEHMTKAGVWGVVRVIEGKLRLEFGDDQSGRLVTSDHPALLLPEQPHWVMPLGPMRMQVDFYDSRPNFEPEPER